MKTITTYITEKANFLVKKHLPAAVDNNDDDDNVVQSTLCDFINWLIDVEDYTIGFTAREIKMRIEFTGIEFKSKINIDTFVYVAINQPGFTICVKEEKLHNGKYALELKFKDANLPYGEYFCKVETDKSYKEHIE